jgi:S1-C subfamily serine protease
MASYEHRPITRSSWGGCVAVLVLLVLAAAGGIALWWFWPEHAGSGLDPNAEPRPVAARDDLSDREQANIKIYEQFAPSLVQVTNLTKQPGSWFSLDEQEVPRGIGSGFVWDKEGHIVTAYHVVEGGNAAQVTLANHATYNAEQIWAYPDLDIAVLWITAPRAKLHPVLVGSSHDLKVGQIVYALGDPFGLDQTMTTGIVSALNRTIRPHDRPITGVIQTSAAINPGNSGGPLLDSAGRLIGMNTAILSPSKAFAGIGFAVPVDDINRVVPQLIKHGKVVRPRLGVQLAADELARQLGIKEGALIVKVLPDSAAAKAGLRGTGRDDDGRLALGDIIVAVDGKAIAHSEDIYTALQRHEVGDTVTLTIIRNGKRQDVKVTLGEANA